MDKVDSAVFAMLDWHDLEHYTYNIQDINTQKMYKNIYDVHILRDTKKEFIHFELIEDEGGFVICFLGPEKRPTTLQQTFMDDLFEELDSVH